MRVVAIMVLSSAVAAAGCSRGNARAGETAFDPKSFVVSTLQTTISNTDLAVMAARRGRLPETRQLGAIMHRQQGEMQSALAAIAQQKRIAIPGGVEPRKRALKENLQILPGQVFDRGYSLAMVQDLGAMIAAFEKASHSDDPQLAAFARQYLPRLREERDVAAQLLRQLGGSPFG